MATIIQALRLLSIVIWVGGIVFFAFVLAPAAFHLLPSTHGAGIIVGGTLRVLDVIGLACGLLFWTTTLVLDRRRKNSLRGQYEPQLLLASAMLLLTAYLHLSIIPDMERDRNLAGGDIEASAAITPAHVHFELLHRRSERVEGAVLLCGLGIVVLLAREIGPGYTVDS